MADEVAGFERPPNKLGAGAGVDEVGADMLVASAGAAVALS